MTDAQFGALLTAVIAGLGGIAGMIKWAVTRITKAMDDQSSSNLRLADAQIELAGAHAAQRADIDHITRWIYANTSPMGSPTPVPNERTPVHQMPTLTPVGLRSFAERRGEDTDDYGERPGSQRRRDAGPPRRTTAVRGVPIAQPQREQVTPNYRRSETHPDDDER